MGKLIVAMHVSLDGFVAGQPDLFVNPVLLGQAIPLFEASATMTHLALQSSRVFGSIGVVYCAYACRA